MGLFNSKKKEGFLADVIRCDEPTYLIWKWHPGSADLGESKREYSIRWGSSLRVKDGEVAVFVYKQKDGTMQDYIVGPYDEKIKTANFPVLSGIVGSLFGGDTPFQAEVYFINLANVIQVKFAVPYFDVSDYRYPDFSVPVAIRGTVSFRIEDYKAFIRCHRLTTFTLEAFQAQIKDAVCRYAKDRVSNVSADFGIPVIKIESKISAVNDALEEDLKRRLANDFGVVVSGVDIGAIEIDKTSDGYAELYAITKDVTTATIKARTAADIENYAETLRIQREEGQYAMHKQTQSANLGAFQIEKQTEVGVAGANALGQMGANNAGNVNLGGGGVGFNPAAMMASIAVGGVVGQNIASVMGSAMTPGAAAPTPPPAPAAAPPVAPPPIPTVAYNVAKDGRSTGPFDMTRLSEMAASGEINADTLVWKQGMAAWERAGAIAELQGLFPPPMI